MDREIKFRGKSLKTGEWTYGYLNKFHTIYDNNKAEKDGDWYVESYIRTDNFTDEGSMQESIAVDPQSVGQYTGFKDVNGKEIYEGDIIKELSNDNTKYNYYKVEFDSAWGMWEVNGETIYVYFEDSEIAGNIIDNPELLEKN